MNNLYYQIWVDAIVYEKTKHGSMRNWKLFTIIPISVLQGINILTLFLLFNALNLKIKIFLDFDLFPGEMLDSFISGFITLFLPFLILNYLVIFRKERYTQLIKKYTYRKGKLYLIYFLLTIGIFIIPIIIGKWIL